MAVLWRSPESLSTAVEWIQTLKIFSQPNQETLKNIYPINILAYYNITEPPGPRFNGIRMIRRSWDRLLWLFRRWWQRLMTCGAASEDLALGLTIFCSRMYVSNKFSVSVYVPICWHHILSIVAFKRSLVEFDIDCCSVISVFTHLSHLYFLCPFAKFFFDKFAWPFIISCFIWLHMFLSICLYIVSDD